MTVDNLKGNKTHLGVTLFVAFFLFLPFWACKGEEIPSTRLITPDLKSEVDLTKDYNSILDYEETNICVEEDTNNLQCVKSQSVVKYLYISDRAVGFAENEDYFSITKNTRTYTSDTGQRTVRVYGSDAFIEVEGTWYETEFGFATPEVWNKASTESLTYLDKWNPFKIYRVSAQDTYYTAAGDGYVRNSNANFATARTAADGTSNVDDNDTNTSLITGLIGGTYYIDWIYLPFNTSDIEDDAVIDTATINFYIWKQENVPGSVDYVASYSTVVSTAALENSDFDLRGFERYTDVQTTAATGTYITLTYTATATETIVLDGYTKIALTDDNDLTGVAPSDNILAFMYTSEHAGTDYDPYLEITLEEEEEPATTTTTTIGLEYPENMCINNDLSIICGMTQHYESTTTLPDWVEYHYFHIPWFVWVIITTVTLWIGNRLLIEFLIRWRQ